MASAPVKLYYFDAPGKAQSIRYAFSIEHIPFEDIRIKKEEFAEYKPKSPSGLFPMLEFPDGSKLIESTAILLYAASQGQKQLIPECPQTFGAAMMIVQFIESLQNEAGAAFHIENEEERTKAVDAVKAACPARLEKLDKAYRKMSVAKPDAKFLFGDKPTFADLYAGCFVSSLTSGPRFKIPEDLVKKAVPKFAQVLESVNGISEVKEFQSKHTTTAH